MHMNNPPSTNALLSVNDLCVSVPTTAGGGRARAVNGVSFSVGVGETVALVGESGCGKSLTALALAGLLPPGVRRESGTIRFHGAEVPTHGRALRAVRGRGLAYVFQEPMASLNPVLTIGLQMDEAVRRHQPGVDVAAESRRLLSRVSLPNPDDVHRVYPHQLSGGQCQRVMIAMALACRPQLLVADEPTTALDVTLQAQILDLLTMIAHEDGMAMLLITHDLGIVARTAARVLVMYAGVVLEQGPTATVLRTPGHPYTCGLLAAVPRLDDPPDQPLNGIKGNVPGPGRRPAGCVFHPRCPQAQPLCSDGSVPLTERQPGHLVRCRLV
ncbi:MAG: ABC transporter ATP-binding protein [bacterium]